MDLSTYDFAYFFGDSMIQQLCRRYKLGLGMGSYWNDKMFYQQNVEQSLTTLKELGTMLQKLRDGHGSNLTGAGTSIAVVTGSSLWDLIRGHVDPGLHRHSRAFEPIIPVWTCTGSHRRPCTFKIYRSYAPMAIRH
jgi:hypothetical protein